MYEYKAKILDVYDGDTFTFEVDLGFSIKVTEKLRLYGINTPEMRGAEKKKGIEVRDYVRDLILDKDVEIKVYKRGKFGRYVADVWIDEINLSEHLLEKGYGVEFMKDD
jgi:micrococcal nuclease